MLYFVPVIFLYKNITFGACKFYILLEIYSLSFPLSFITWHGPGDALNVWTTMVNGTRDMRENLQLPKHKTKYPVLEFARVTPSITLLCFLKIEALWSHRRGGPCLLSRNAQFSIFVLQWVARWRSRDPLGSGRFRDVWSSQTSISSHWAAWPWLGLGSPLTAPLNLRLKTEVTSLSDRTQVDAWILPLPLCSCEPSWCFWVRADYIGGIGRSGFTLCPHL